MRTVFAVGLNWLHQVLLSVWLGGIVVLGAIAGPAVFGAARQAGDTHHGTPLWDFAGTAMGLVFARFNVLLLVGSAVMLAAGIGYGQLAGLCRRRMTVRAGLTALAWLVVLWTEFSLFPQMNAARIQGNLDAFDSMHHLSRHAFEAQMLLLLTVAALTGWMHLDLAPYASEHREQAGGASHATVPHTL
jgi:hypothetical protein